MAQLEVSIKEEPVEFEEDYTGDELPSSLTRTFPWLEQDPGTGLPVCSWCTEVGHQHFYLKDINMETMASHVWSRAHQQAERLCNGNALMTDMLTQVKEEGNTPVLSDKTSTDNGRRKFCDHWLNIFPWLIFDGVRHKMFCSVCIEWGGSSHISFVKGSRSFKKCTLQAHEVCEAHKASLKRSGLTLPSSKKGGKYSRDYDDDVTPTEAKHKPETEEVVRNIEDPKTNEEQGKFFTPDSTEMDYTIEVNDLENLEDTCDSEVVGDLENGDVTWDQEDNEIDQEGSIQASDSPLSEKKRRRFCRHWLVQFPWLKYDREHGLLLCKVCIKHNPNTNNSFIKGNQHMRVTTIQAHAYCREHQVAERADAFSRSDSLKKDSSVSEMTPKQQHVLGKFLKFFPWLLYSADLNVVVCDICQRHGTNSLYVDCSSELEYDIIRTHCETTRHAKCEEIEVKSWTLTWDAQHSKQKQGDPDASDIHSSSSQSPDGTNSKARSVEHSTEKEKESDPVGGVTVRDPDVPHPTGLMADPIEQSDNGDATDNNNIKFGNEIGLRTKCEEESTMPDDKVALREMIYSSVPGHSNLKQSPETLSDGSDSQSTLSAPVEDSTNNFWAAYNNLVILNNLDVAYQPGSCANKRPKSKYKSRKSNILPAFGKFKPEWLSEFSWLHYDPRSDIMRCVYCAKHEKCTTFARGVRIFSRSGLIHHTKIAKHRDALALEGLPIEIYPEPSPKKRRCRNLTELAEEVAGTVPQYLGETLEDPETGVQAQTSLVDSDEDSEGQDGEKIGDDEGNNNTVTNKKSPEKPVTAVQTARESAKVLPDNWDQLDSKKRYELKRERRFLPSWRHTFPWVVYDENTKKMYCEICLQHKPDGNTTFLKGCTTLRSTTLQIHEKCHDHQMAVLTLHKKSRQGKLENATSALTAIVPMECDTGCSKNVSVEIVPGPGSDSDSLRSSSESLTGSLEVLGVQPGF